MSTIGAGIAFLAIILSLVAFWHEWHLAKARRRFERERAKARLAIEHEDEPVTFYPSRKKREW